MKFSIIVPVYNVASFLRECLDSIVTATRRIDGADGTDNVEVVCVDDGATDGSSRILDEYVKTQAEASCKWRIVHQSNSGVSVARNRGLDIATGEYVCFVDADDTVNPDWLENYANAIEKYKHPDLIRLNALTGETEERLCLGATAWDWAWRSWIEHGYVWTFCIKREIAQKARFPEGIACCEDSLYELQLTPYIKSGVQLNTSAYCYRVVEGSASNRKLKSEERLRAVRKVVELAGRKDLRLHPRVFSSCAWGNVSMWARNPADKIYAKEIYREFKKLKALGWTPVSRLGARKILFYWFYRTTGWVWTMQAYDVVMGALSKIKKGLRKCR